MSLPNVSSGDPHVSAHNAERAAITAVEEELPNKIDKPTVPMEGDVLRYDGQAWSTFNLRFFEGEGPPNGVVAGPLGSHYTDFAGTNGAVEWVKASGAAGNTGWLLVAGDTGWRNVSGLTQLRTNGSCYAALLRRVGDSVDLYLDLKNPTNIASPWAVMTLPVGFRPGFERYGGLQDNRELAADYTMVSAAGVVNLYAIKSAKRDRYQGQWLTNDAWPVGALPGSAG